MNASPIAGLDLTRRLQNDSDGSVLGELGALLRDEQASMRNRLDGGAAPSEYRHAQAYLEALTAGESILNQVWQFMHTNNKTEVSPCQD
ncbi:EscE/YscE/SsaE family type III secretion system needle protein co-chaperone [Acanthopleuribacter pedis]|uniref:EscE/YscE/SsaE family type III secretion system needle protein co-chaperone n=1 Tax=Acanthopleuribacter pedis TaxID=442870 RepID=A0A8J7QQG5_9BACT|nr:hypothetical protein [Acanthopleuribacter pedis]MBO1322985.1 hypothetical protein [Acanthopleuribacter pedis]